MAFVWQIREKNTGLWVRDSSQGWHHLVEQDAAYLWRRQDLAEKALKEVHKRLKKITAGEKHYLWYKGFTVFKDGAVQRKLVQEVDFEIVCSKLVYAETV